MIDVATSVDGSGTIWTLGQDHYVYYNYKGTWTKLPALGQGQAIAVDHHGSPWMVGNDNAVWSLVGDYKTGVWHKRADGTCARQIGVGVDGSVWIIGCTPLSGGYNIAKYDAERDTFVNVPGAALYIDVSPNGDPWVVNNGGAIYHRKNDAWIQVAGCAKEIACGADGSLWVLGCAAVSGGYEIFTMINNIWTKIPGGATRIAALNQDSAAVVNNAGTTYRTYIQ